MKIFPFYAKILHTAGRKSLAGFMIRVTDMRNVGFYHWHNGTLLYIYYDHLLWNIYVRTHARAYTLCESYTESFAEGDIFLGIGLYQHD